MKQKSENRRALPNFLITLLAAAVIGGTAGGASVFVGAWLRKRGPLDLTALMQTAGLWGLPIFSAGLLGGAWYFYRAAKQAFRGWDGEDEAVMDRAEERLSRGMLLTTLAMIGVFFFFSVGTAGLMDGGLRPSLLIAAEMVVASAAIIVFQQKLVDLLKEMNPEKHGSVYDKRFQKIWWESCDENERRQIGQASYKAYTTVSVLCPALWGVLFFGNLVFDYGILPGTVALVIWGVAQVRYTVECIRLSRGHASQD